MHTLVNAWKQLIYELLNFNLFLCKFDVNMFYFFIFTCSWCHLIWWPINFGQLFIYSQYKVLSLVSWSFLTWRHLIRWPIDFGQLYNCSLTSNTDCLLSLDPSMIHIVMRKKWNEWDNETLPANSQCCFRCA